MSVSKNKRDAVLDVISKKGPQEYFPAAFFLHFDKACHFGQAAVDKHLEFFRHTGMDFVKIQYERRFPPLPEIKKPADWKNMPLRKLDFYEPQLAVVKGLVAAARKEALVVVTLFSPFTCLGHTTSRETVVRHLEEDPEQVKKGLQIVTESLMLFVKECIRLGLDGFYTSTQGGEKDTFKDHRLFKEYIKPHDLVLMNEARQSCVFNILHVCDYVAPYADWTPFLDYPGHVVNCNPDLVSGSVTWQEVARLFKRPCMGGMDRKGIIVSGKPEEITKAVEQVLSAAPERMILGTDCTLPVDTWDNIKTAIAAAHAFRKNG